MPLLELARTWGLAISLSLFVLGTAWRAYAILRRPAYRDLSAPRSTALAAGAMRGIVRRMWHPATLRRRALTATIFGYAFHVGLAIVFFGFGPHIAFVQRLTGISWPALPGPVFVAGVALAYVGLGYAIAARLTSPVLKMLSTFDDYLSWLLTALPMVTGMAVLSLPLTARYPLVPDRPLIVALHLLSFELLVAWLPFGKLAHAFLAFVSRGTTGVAFARKGAAP
ncbi:MAG: nitrate reductase [Betaproteobacteria bacterium]